VNGLPFEHPEWIAALGGAWLAACAAVWLGIARARTRLGRLGARLAGGRFRVPIGEDVARLLALLCIGIALLGPRLGERTVRVPATGSDVVLLLDLSRSMTARDVPPTRLARARRAAAEVLRRLDAGDRAALAVFAGRGALLTPLTHDAAALSDMLPSLDSDLMSDTATRGDAGITAALSAFDPESLRPRALLVLSDGESRGFGRDDVAVELAGQEVRLFAGLVGTDEGSTIPTAKGALLDAFGKPVTTRRESEPLASLAKLSGGRALAADPWGELDADSLMAALKRDVLPTPDGTIERRVPVSRFAAPALLSLALLMLRFPRPRSGAGSSVLHGRSRKYMIASAALLLVATAVALPARAELPRLFELELEVRQNPGNAKLLIELGLERARAGAHKEAEHAFLAAALQAREPRVAGLAFYDLGVVSIERGALTEARDAFFDSLAVWPEDPHAKFNLEWTLRALDPERAAGEGEGERPRPLEELRDDIDRQTEERAREQRDASAPAPEQTSEKSPIQQPPSLDGDDARRWLAGIEDDPGRALRDAVRAQQGDASGAAGPRW